MRHPEYDTVVRSVAGQAELRRVADVHEWRIEQALDSNALVVSVVMADGEARSFLLAQVDAQDMGDVLLRKAGAVVG